MSSIKDYISFFNFHDLFNVKTPIAVFFMLLPIRINSFWYAREIYERNLCILDERLTNEKIERGKVGGYVRNRFFGAVSTVYRLDGKTLATL
jgi:hypothetical protein